MFNSLTTKIIKKEKKKPQNYDEIVNKIVKHINGNYSSAIKNLEDKKYQIYKYDDRIISAIINNKEYNYKNLPWDNGYRGNKQLFLKTLEKSKDGYLLRYATDELKEDFDCVINSIILKPYAIDYVENIITQEKGEERINLLQNLIYYLLKTDIQIRYFISHTLLKESNLKIENESREQELNRLIKEANNYEFDKSSLKKLKLLVGESKEIKETKRISITEAVKSSYRHQQ